MTIRVEIINALTKITGLKSGGIHLETPEREEFGDYSSNIALAIFSKSQILNSRPEHDQPLADKSQIKLKFSNSKFKTAIELAETIITEIRNSKLEIRNYIDKIEVAGPGFINFWLKKDLLINNLAQINNEKADYGKSGFGKGKTVVIDYSSPNIARRFSIGHLRSTIIGQAIYNLYQSLGYEVIGDNHLGDWGTQFGKLLFMLDKYGYESFDVDKLEGLYIEFHKLAEADPKVEEEGRNWFKKLENGDTQARQLWKKCVDVSLNEFNRIYEMLEVEIDYAHGESFYEEEMNKLKANFDKGVLKGLEQGEEGAMVVPLDDYGIHVPLMFLKSDGTTTYATRDLACIRYRVKKWNPIKIIYEVGGEQTLYFQQLFAAARKIGLISADTELYHTKHGLYLDQSGKRFRTRKGETVKLEEVLLASIEKAKELGSKDEETAKMVGIGAIKYFDLMHSVSSDIVFDWDKVMNLQGNSGPYLQYAYARCQSVFKRAKFPISNFQFPMNSKLSNFQINKSKTNWGPETGDWKLNAEELLLLRSFIHYPEVVEDAAKNYSPNLLCNYLFELAQKFNTFYDKHRILDSGVKGKRHEIKEFRLALTAATGQILKNGLNLLGIKSPEKM